MMNRFRAGLILMFFLAAGCNSASESVSSDVPTTEPQTPTHTDTVEPEPELESKPIGPLLCKIDGEEWHFNFDSSSIFADKDYVYLSFSNKEIGEQVSMKYKFKSKSLYEATYWRRRVNQDTGNRESDDFMFRANVTDDGLVEGDFGMIRVKGKKRNKKLSGSASDLTLTATRFQNNQEVTLEVSVTDLKFRDINSNVVKPRK